jgi:ABC-2 type transport system ATP-binding protein
VIVVDGLRKAYGARVAVDGLSFTVEQGEILGLLGPNGAGKSTTIGMIVGAMKPDAGRVCIGGQDDPRRPEVRRQIGLAPQALAIYPELTAAENLRFFGALYGLRGARLGERVAWALELAGLAERSGDRAGTFSGGMQRRLNLAAALIHDPPVVLLDEPTVGVDPQSRNHLFDSILGLQAQGRTIVYTTHYMEEAETLCDRVAIVDGGKLLALGTVEELVDRHGGPSVIEVEVGGEVGGELERIESTKPMEEVTRLVSSGRAITRLHVDRPNLEAVFLGLTGKRLRD